MFAIVGAIAVATVLSTAAQESQAPTFRSGVRLVEVDVTVRDRDDHFVDTLTKDDFEVLEDGVPRQIQQSWVVNLPAGRKTDPAVPAATPVLPALVGSATDVGRLYVLVLADGGLEKVRTIARQFITTLLGPNDLMAVVHVGNRDATQGLTADRELLLASVDRYRGGRGPDASLAMLKEITVSLNASTGRRKAVLYIGSAGFDLWSNGASVEQGVAAYRLTRVFEDVERVAKRNNVRIYPISPAYVDVGGDVGVIRTGNMGDGSSSLGLLAYDTHGTAVWKMSDLKKIVRDNSAYYLLTYESGAEADGHPHPITVRLRNRPKLSLEQGRLSVSAPTPDVKGRSARMPKGLSAEAKRALTPSTGMQLPAGDSGIELFTAVFQGADFNGSILIGTHVPGASLRLAPNETIELSYVAVDRWGVTRAAQRQAFRLNLGDENRARVAESGVRLLGRLQVPRGQYQIRVAAHQPNGITASAVTEVEVPDYADQALTVSEFLVSSSHGPMLLTLEDDPLLRGVLPAQPMPARRFRRGETLTVFAEITDTHWILSQEVGVTTTVVAGDGRMVFRGDQTLTTANKGHFYLTSTLPLGGFAPGDYQLVVEANTRKGIPANTSRQMGFTVLAAAVPATTGLVASKAVNGQAFELVSVRRSAAPAPPSPGAGVPRGEFRLIPDGRVEARGQTLADLARVAYGFEQVDPKSGVVDADPWMWTTRFDVIAAAGQPWTTPPSGSKVPSELRTMLRAMLEDRFRLQARIVTKKVEVIALQLAKPDRLGPGLRPSTVTCRGTPADTPPSQAGRVAQDPATVPTSDCRVVNTPTEIDARSATMTEVAALLSQNSTFRGLGLFVDQTGLSGRYDLSFSVRKRGTGRLPADMLQTQLGVKLKTTRMPLPTLVIDKASRPKED
jgi:uncharacterized protein (TIGR03435 family)